MFLSFKVVSRKLLFVVSLVFIEVSVLIGLWFFLITGFVSVNVRLKLIVCDKHYSLHELFILAMYFGYVYT